MVGTKAVDTVVPVSSRADLENEKKQTNFRAIFYITLKECDSQHFDPEF